VILDFSALFAFCDLHASRWHLRSPLEKLDMILSDEPLPPRYFDRQGFPIPGDDAAGLPPCIVWARRFEGEGNRVAWDELPDGSYLSTVWLGIDHSFLMGPPQLFETMRFHGATHVVRMLSPSEAPLEMTGRESLDFQDPVDGEWTSGLRYSTEEEALAAHHEIVRRFRIREGH
jgi:hypothetical protein